MFIEIKQMLLNGCSVLSFRISSVRNPQSKDNTLKKRMPTGKYRMLKINNLMAKLKVFH